MSEEVKEIKKIEEKYIHKRKNGMIFLKPEESLFSVDGVKMRKGKKKLFFRVENEKARYSKGIQKRMYHTAGGRIRFATDSRHLALKIRMENIEAMPWQARTGAAGVDIYTGNGRECKWEGTFAATSIRKRICAFLELTGKVNDSMREITVNLPLYAEVKEIYIGIDAGSRIAAPSPYRIKNPIVFYGSSITQGCAAGRPGTSFPAVTARFFNADYLNMGFSSSARGEKEMAEMISDIRMSAFVMEYDHNAETTEELKERHYKFYKTVREKNPGIPIILLSRFSGGLSASVQETEARRDEIWRTFVKGRGDNDQKLYFIDGGTAVPETVRELCFSDGKHPNDYGMNLIADAIIEKLKEAGFGEQE